MRWTDAGLVAAVLAVAATSAQAASGEVGRMPTCIHGARAGRVIEVDRAKRPVDPERVIVGLIGAGTTAWNATLGGILPAPELALRAKPATSKATASLRV